MLLLPYLQRASPAGQINVREYIRPFGVCKRHSTGYNRSSYTLPHQATLWKSPSGYPGLFCEVMQKNETVILTAKKQYSMGQWTQLSPSKCLITGAPARVPVTIILQPNAGPAYRVLRPCISYRPAGFERRGPNATYGFAGMAFPTAGT